MIRIIRAGAALSLALGLAACAQPAPEPEMTGPTVDATTASIRAVNSNVTGYIVQAAGAVPEETYSYQPAPEVRTMGQLFGHIANASFFFCSTASGMTAPERPDAETLATKAEIQAALADSVAYCNQAFDSISADNANEAVQMLNAEHTRLGALAFHNAHIYEHYGNIVTYMRSNGMVPPSSAGGQ